MERLAAEAGLAVPQMTAEEVQRRAAAAAAPAAAAAAAKDEDEGEEEEEDEGRAAAAAADAAAAARVRCESAAERRPLDRERSAIAKWLCSGPLLAPSYLTKPVTDHALLPSPLEQNGSPP